MNIVLENEKVKNQKLKIFYLTIIIICVLAIISTCIVQIKKYLETNGSLTQEEIDIENINKYKQEFYNIFENKVNYLKNNKYKITKIDKSQEIVYLGYQNNDRKISDYELNVNIPYINIKDEVIEKYNQEIKDTFEQKVKSVINTSNNNIIYNVDYVAYISNNILSLIIRSTLKEGANAQRDIIQTYNYDLTNHKECTIDTMLELKGIIKKEAEQKIQNEIKSIQERIDNLANLGYSVYPRDYTNSIYNINNVTEFFIGRDNVLYIIFAYGNTNHTSEMDIVVM